jgi:RsiW-degrading membrane proteinase PrsW (M82 family)
MYDRAMLIPALLIAILIPALVLYWMRTLDLYRTGEFRFLLLCFGGGVAGFGLAFLVNRTLILNGVISNLNVVRFSAPVAEEILKALILFLVVRSSRFTYFVDGALYGFAAGVGFAIVENIEYILGAPGAALGIAVTRVISTNLMHAAATAVIGVSFGLARFERASRRTLLVMGGFALAMTLHMVFNNLVTRISNPLILLLCAVLIGLGGAGFVVWTIRRGLREEKGWIEEKLGMADRVTSGEAAVVQRMDQLKTLLAPLAKRFGAAKADQMEELLLLQARLGILRKTIEKLSSDERMRKNVEAQAEQIYQQMEALRRSLGPYVMLYLRNIFPENASPVWQRLETILAEKAANRARGEAPAVNVWATLGQRTARPASSQDDSKSSSS